MPLYRYLGGASANLLPVPMFNILNGGVHANWQSTDLQEFMIAPVGAPNFREACAGGTETYQALKSVLKSAGYTTGVGDEGGFAPAFKKNSDAVDVILVPSRRPDIVQAGTSSWPSTGPSAASTRTAFTI